MQSRESTGVRVVKRVVNIVRVVDWVMVDTAALVITEVRYCVVWGSVVLMTGMFTEVTDTKFSEDVWWFVCSTDMNCGVPSPCVGSTDVWKSTPEISLRVDTVGSKVVGSSGVLPTTEGKG
jgi:hypothetical protein